MADFLNQVLPAIEAAILLDLPDVIWKSGVPLMKRRPNRSEVSVYAFPQIWPNSACGFPANDAQEQPVMAYSVVVVMGQAAAVYFAGTLAYVVPVSSDLAHDIATQTMHPVVGADKHYGRDPRKIEYPTEDR